MVGGRGRSWGLGVALVGLMTATNATALPVARPAPHPWLVQAQETGAPGESSTAERLRAVVEGIKQRLNAQEAPDEAPPAIGTPTPAQPLEAVVRTMRNRVVELAKALSEMRAERERLAAELAAREREIERLRQAVTAARETAEKRAAEQVRALEQKLEATEQARRELAERLDTTQEQLAASQRELETLRKARAELEAKLRDTEKQVAELTRSMKQAWEERDALAKQLEQAKAALADQQKEFDRQMAQAQERLRESEAQIARLREAGVTQSKQIGQLEEQVVQLQKRVQELVKENTDLQAIAVESVNQLKVVSDRLFRALEEKERLLRTLATLRETEQVIEQHLGSEPATVAPAAGEADGDTSAGPAVRRFRVPAASEAPTPDAPPTESSEPEAPGPRSETASRQQVAALQTPTAPTGDDEGLQVTMTEDGWLRTVLEGLEFEPGSAEPKPGYETVLQRAAALARLYPDAPIRIEGHTDSVGDAERNRALSLQRARRVRDLLVRNHGLAAARIEVLGLGEERPIASNDTPEGRARNRRIELWIRPSGVPATASATPTN